jgi:hypothetical protein
LLPVGPTSCPPALVTTIHALVSDRCALRGAFGRDGKTDGIDSLPICQIASFTYEQGPPVVNRVGVTGEKKVDINQGLERLVDDVAAIVNGLSRFDVSD